MVTKKAYATCKKKIIYGWDYDHMCQYKTRISATFKRYENSYAALIHMYIWCKKMVFNGTVTFIILN